MKLLSFALLACAAAASENPQLKQVQAVYILPMGRGMDQYLANKLTRQGLFLIVTDPQKADAILTDHIGEGFERKIEELYPPPKPEKVAKDDKAAKDGKTAKDDKDAASGKSDTDKKDESAINAAVVMNRTSSFSRGKGTIFLVDRKSRAVIWSTYDRASNGSSDTLDKTADQIVTRLKRDLKETK